MPKKRKTNRLEINKMRNKAILVIFVVSLLASVSIAQQESKTDPQTSVRVDDKSRTNSPSTKKDEKKIVTLPSPYVRPNASRRFKAYVLGIVGPTSIIKSVASSGVLTWRNSPYEWGSKTPGFGRRIANSFGKTAIDRTVVYGLDEALSLDSKFYLSRDRRVKARLRNAVFSVVTARNKKGERVFGLPKVAGSFASSIGSSTIWYPNRFGVSHGLRGGAVSLAVTAGVNILREFVLKK